MNEKENLSAWMDNELSESSGAEIQRKLLESAEMRRFYSDAILIGDALRSQETLNTRSVANRVAARLAREPVHFYNPQAMQPAVTDRLPQRARSRQVLVGAVAAAAVAFVALVAVAPQMQGGGVTEIIAGVSSGMTGGGGSPTMLSVQSATPVMLEDPRLRELLEAHGSMSIRPVSAEVR